MSVYVCTHAHIEIHTYVCTCIQMCFSKVHTSESLYVFNPSLLGGFYLHAQKHTYICTYIYMYLHIFISFGVGRKGGLRSRSSKSR